MVAIPPLVFKLRALGVVDASKKVQAFQTRFNKLSSKTKPALEAMRKGWLKLGVVMGGALFKLIDASPRLRMQMSLINFQANKLFRVFGDALAPVFKGIANALGGVVKWFKSLPEPIQSAITFGTTLAIVCGLLAVAIGALMAAASPVTLVLLAIAAAAAILYLAWESNFLGIQDIALSVFEALKPLFESIINIIGVLVKVIQSLLVAAKPVFEGIMGAVKIFVDFWVNHFLNIIKFIEGFVKIIEKLLKGDISGAINAAINFLKTGFDTFMSYVTNFPKMLFGVFDSLTGGMLKSFADAGFELAMEFIGGIQKAVDAAGDLVEGVLDGIAGLFGGSLPERGPLKEIDVMGRELGTSYIRGLSEGLSSSKVTNILNRNMYIDAIEISAKEDLFRDATTLGRDIEQNLLRRATSW